jgi:SHS2 domain-containing protein
LVRECVILYLARSQVTARLRGEAFDPARHQLKQEIKAVTYHQAFVQTTVQGWKGRVILDV